MVEQTAVAEDENVEKAPSGIKKIIILAGVGVLMMGIGIGGTVFFMGGESEETASTAEEAAEEEMEMPMMQDAIYHDLHPAFVANFSGDSKRKYMQVYVVAMAHDQDTIDELRLHMPAVRNNILMTLSDKTSEEVETVDGKEQLRKEVLDVVQKTMEEKTGKKGIQDLYFTKFVAQ